MNLLLLLSGGKELTVAPQDRTAVMDLCLQNGYTYTSFSWLEDGSVRFWCDPRTAKRLLAACKARALSVKVTGAYGIPFLFFSLRRRPGLVIGALFSVLLLILSGNFVWHVQIKGNTTLAPGEVLELLESCGLSTGSYIPDINSGELENRILLSTDRISWISVNLDGTVAHVQVVERAEGDYGSDPPEALKKPANLIATQDGQIEYLELYRGNAVVKVGQAVKKGDLLVSGLYDSQVSGFRYTRAAGSVYARTERTFTVEIPLSYEQKIYTAPKTQEITLNFFDFSLKIFKMGGNPAPECDIIEKKTDLESFGTYPLPVSLSRLVAYPYRAETLTRAPEEALELAYLQLENELGAFSEGRELLRKQITTEVGEDAVRLTCTVLCIENIAERSEFEIKEHE